LILETRSPEETRALGRRLGRRLKPLDLVCLFGQLGAGKTVFVAGLAEGLGYKGRVASPTFALAKDYRAPKLTLHHLDLFRLGPGELGNVGLEEYLSDDGAATAIEWPESAEAFLPSDRLEIRLDVKPDRRVVTATAAGARAAQLAKVFDNLAQR
jgi:tRNA threonylcarbamoyladenosine biosynthesis protein TsaE